MAHGIEPRKENYKFNSECKTGEFMVRKNLKARRWPRILLYCSFFLIIFTAACIILVTRIHNFLAIQAALDSEIVVVSGTLPDSALEKIVDDVGTNVTTMVLTVGGPISRGSHLSEYRDYANLAAATLKQLGVPSAAVVAIPAPKSERDRVFASALALRDWLADSDIEIESINVYTVGVRGRRTLLLFREALKPDISVGIVSLTDEDYDSTVWWTTSEGFRTVISELIAYVYVKTTFRTARPE